MHVRTETAQRGWAPTAASRAACLHPPIFWCCHSPCDYGWKSQHQLADISRARKRRQGVNWLPTAWCIARAARSCENSVRHAKGAWRRRSPVNANIPFTTVFAEAPQSPACPSPRCTRRYLRWARIRSTVSAKSEASIVGRGAKQCLSLSRYFPARTRIACPAPVDIAPATSDSASSPTRDQRIILVDHSRQIWEQAAYAHSTSLPKRSVAHKPWTVGTQVKRTKRVAYQHGKGPHPPIATTKLRKGSSSCSLLVRSASEYWP